LVTLLVRFNGYLPAIARDLPATRLPSPGTWGRFNATMRGNGGQVALCAGIAVARRAWRWQAGAGT